MRFPLLLFALLAQASPVLAQEAPCQGNQSPLGACTVLRGRVAAYNGSPTFRIWPIGSRRLLGVLPADGANLPDNLQGQVTFDQDVVATLRVCPLSRQRPGAMQFVCIASASRIRVVPR